MRNDLVQHAAAVYSKHSKTKHARSRTQHARKRYAREASRKGGKNGQKSQARQRAKRCSLGRARGRSYARRYPCRAPPYRANFNLPCHDRMPPFVRENLPTQRVKTAAKAGRNFPLFFPLCRYFPLHSRCYAITQKAHSTMHKRKALHRRKCKFAVQIWVSPPNVRILSRNARNPFFFALTL